MYTAFLAAFTGLVLVCANWFVGLAAGLGYGAAMLIRTPGEERMLIEEFGDEYRAYMARTGRFLPKAGRLTRRCS
jgi:protein-S-isoprenylcysteine O-methyltransferase Ste14